MPWKHGLPGCAAERASDAEITVLKGILDTMPESMSSLELYVQADRGFHLELAHLTHNMLFVTIVESLLFPLQRSFKRSFEGHDSALLYREHLGIYTCVEKHDARGGAGGHARSPGTCHQVPPPGAGMSDPPGAGPPPGAASYALALSA